MSFNKLYSTNDSIFKRHYKSFGISVTSAIPKYSSFDYFYKASENPLTFYGYSVYNKTKVHQKLSVGAGFDYSFYWRIKKGYFSSIYLCSANALNLYTYKFYKEGEEYAYGNFFFSKINEKSYNLVYEPSLNISYQKRYSNKIIMNYETGLGFNCQFFYFINKQSKDEVSNFIHNEKVYSFPMQLFLKAPLKVEMIYKFKSKTFGLALISQFNDSYAFLYKDLRNGRAYNSIGSTHQFGFNSPTLLYYYNASNNYPTQSFNLNLLISLKF